MFEIAVVDVLTHDQYQKKMEEQQKMMQLQQQLQNRGQQQPQQQPQQRHRRKGNRILILTIVTQFLRPHKIWSSSRVFETCEVFVLETCEV